MIKFGSFGRSPSLQGLLFGVILFYSNSVQAQSISLSSNTISGIPGDTITFDYGYDVGSESKDRTEIKFDGADLGRSDVHAGTTSNVVNSPTVGGGRFTWTATPGTHVFRMHLRTKAADGTKKYITDMKVVQISGWETNEFSHPGLLLSEDEIDRIKEKINAPASSATKTAWNSYNARWNYTSEYGGWQLAAITPTNDVKRAHYHDSNHLIENAVAWALSGEDKYADAVIGILNAWAATTEQWWGPDGGVYPFLTTTHYMDRWVIAAEIMRDYKGGYTGWLPEDRAQFELFARNVMVPVTLGWWGNLGNPLGSSNQPLNVAKARIVLGIYLDDKALFQSGYDHMFTTMHLSRNLNPGLAGALNQWPATSPINKSGTSLSIFELSIDKGGEYTEVNRTPAPNLGHMGMSNEAIQLMAEALCHQGFDMYDMQVGSESSPRFLQGQEWLERIESPGITMQLHTSRGNITATNPTRDYEAAYNHYKYRSTGNYDLSALEAYVAQKRAASTKGLDVLIHSDLSKDVGQVDCQSVLPPPTCESPATMCDGTCVSTSNDESHCGSCGNTCASDRECTSGSCSCTGLLSDCGDSCVDIQLDSSNCGACGTTCDAGATCQGGVCQGETGPTCGDGTCDVGEDCSSCSGDCGGCSSNVLPINASFDNGAEGFTYSDDAFNDTNAPAYASGTTGAGDLTIKLGGVDSIRTSSSGGYSIDFTMLEAAEVNIAISYTMTVAAFYEGDEFGETLATMDGTLLGESGKLAHENGNGAGDNTGTFSSTISLAAGEHTFVVGAYNNKKTAANEVTTVKVHSVDIVESDGGNTGPVCGNNSCESGEDCTNCTSDCGTCPTEATCTERCGNYNSSKSCQCDSQCTQFNDCCTDYSSLCSTSPQAKVMTLGPRGEIVDTESTEVNIENGLDVLSMVSVGEPASSTEPVHDIDGSDAAHGSGGCSIESPRPGRTPTGLLLLAASLLGLVRLRRRQEDVS